MTAIPRPRTAAEWAPLRRDHVGAGSAACLINRHPHLTLQRYAVRKLTGDDEPSTEAMDRGLTLEDGVAHLWERKHRIGLEPSAYVFQRGPLIASPDFVPIGSEDSPAFFVECKTTYEYLAGEPLDYWVIQCILQAWCAEIDTVHIAALDASMSLRDFTVDATTDQARTLVATIVEAAERFLAYTSMGMVPEGLALTEYVVKALYPKAERRAVTIDAQTLSWVHELSEARELKHAAEKREQDAKDALAAVLVDADVADYEGTEVLTWRNAKSALRVDHKGLEADHPALVDSYRRPVPGARSMRVPKAAQGVLEAMPWAAGDEEDGGSW